MLHPKNQIKLQNQDIDFVIKVENMGNDKITNVPIEITLDEKRMGQIAASFEEKEVKDFLFRILPPKVRNLKWKCEHRF